METGKWIECVVINNQQYRVEGFGEDMRDGSFRSVCHIVTTGADSTHTKRLAFQIFSPQQDLAAEVGLRCGVDKLSKKHSRNNVAFG